MSELSMTGSRRGNKNDIDLKKKGQNANSKTASSMANTPPQINMEGSMQGQGVQINSQTSNLMGQARELLYGPAGYSSPSDAYTSPGVLQTQQPQHPSFLHQTFPQPPQAPPFVQNSYYNQFGVSTMSAGNQHRSPVLNTTAHIASMNNNGTNDQLYSGAPQWVNMLMETLDSRLHNIETKISGQNQKWCSIETQLQSQNNRMLNIEQKVSQMNDVKQSVAKVQLQVSDVDQRVKNVQTQMNAYDESIHHSNDLCDGIVEENSSNSTLVQELNKRVSKLEADSDEMKDKHEKMEEKMTDLQWRSMRENLIFTGIKERDYPNEDTETSLRLFLADEMNIHYDIPFDRVHRLGKFDSTKIYPRPIIAKFERFRDRERVRLAAPAALRGKDYGVREQFPAEIENKRRELYPIMKRYKHNTNNKVALVRDKLYINGVQYIPSSSENRSNSQTDHKRSYQPYQREHEHIHSRTFTRRFSSHTGYKSGSMASTESSSKCWDNGAPSIETPNRFRHLRNVTDENEMLSEVSYGKRKATSPLQDETSLKSKVVTYSLNHSTENTTVK